MKCMKSVFKKADKFQRHGRRGRPFHRKKSRYTHLEIGGSKTSVRSSGKEHSRAKRWCRGGLYRLGDQLCIALCWESIQTMVCSSKLGQTGNR